MNKFILMIIAILFVPHLKGQKNREIVTKDLNSALSIHTNYEIYYSSKDINLNVAVSTEVGFTKVGDRRVFTLTLEYINSSYDHRCFKNPESYVEIYFQGEQVQLKHITDISCSYANKPGYLTAIIPPEDEHLFRESRVEKMKIRFSESSWPEVEIIGNSKKVDPSTTFIRAFEVLDNVTYQ